MFSPWSSKILKPVLSRKEYLFVYFLALYSAYYLITSLSVAWNFTTDDAYISWFYARQLVHGQGFHWQNTLPAVEGYSNFLWVIFAALVMKAQWPLALTIKWISVLSLGMGLIFLYRLSRLFLSPLLAMLPIFLFSHYTGVVWWTVSGLESTFYWALSLLFIWQCAASFGYRTDSEQVSKPTQQATYSWVVANCALLFLGLTRFEGIIWIIPAVFFISCQLRKNGISGFSQGYRTLRLWGMISCCCFVLPYTIYFIWRLNYFGHLIPNSYRCKAWFSGQTAVVDLDYLRVSMALIVASLPYFLGSKDCRHLLLWLPSVLYGLMLWNADPLLAYHLRFFLGPLALFSLLAVLGVYQFLHYFKYSQWNIKVMTVFVTILCAFVFIPGNNLVTLRANTLEYQGRMQNRMMIATLLNTQAKPGDTVLLDDCGLILFNARPDIRFIDSQCLNNEYLAQAIARNHIMDYIKYLQNQVKPEWVVMNKFSFRVHLNLLMEALEQKNFLQEYQLVAVLDSRVTPKDTLEPTAHYLVYKRKPQGNQ
jgi:hypothetical protein